MLLYIELPDNGEGICVFFSAWLDTSPGTHSAGLSVMLLLGAVDIRRNTGKCRSEHKKIGSEGFLDFPSNKTKAQFLELLA